MSRAHRRRYSQGNGQRVEHLAAASHARSTLAQTEPAVAQGGGPAVTHLETTLADLRRQLELRTRVDDVQRRWNPPGPKPACWPPAPAPNTCRRRGPRGGGPGCAIGAWPRPAELQTLSDRAQAAAENLARQRDELLAQTR